MGQEAAQHHVAASEHAQENGLWQSVFYIERQVPWGTLLQSGSRVPQRVRELSSRHRPCRTITLGWPLITQHSPSYRAASWTSEQPILQIACPDPSSTFGYSKGIQLDEGSTDLDLTERFIIL
jgi:hypothetical protein